MEHLTNYSFDIVEPNQVRTYTISLAYTDINENDQCLFFYLNKNIIEQIPGSKYRQNKFCLNKITRLVTIDH